MAVSIQRTFYEDKIMNERPDFSNLESMKVKPSSTAIYVFHDIEGEPTLLVKPAHEVNTPYINAVLKKSNKRMMRMLQRGKMNKSMLDDNREKDYSLFSKYIIEDWTVSPKDVAGQSVGFSKENCEDFLRAIPVDMFNDLRDFCADIDNFRDDEDSHDEESREGQAKN